MKRIFKYMPEDGTEVGILMPEDAEILSAQLQHGKLAIWAKVGVSPVLKTSWFKMIMTGEKFDDTNLKYITTIQFQGGGIIGHLFQEVR